MQIPLVPLPLKKATTIAKRFMPAGEKLVKFFPSLRKDLYQAKIKIDPIEYVSLAFAIALFYFFLVSGLIGLIAFAGTGTIPLIAPAAGALLSFSSFLYLIFWPKLVATRRMRTLETNLLFALRHLLIEIRAGIPLFNSMVSISTGYGEVSEEFKRVVREINAGSSQTEALDAAAKRNPSMYFRRALWQLVNALRGGADIADTLQAITDDFAKRQAIEVRKYGQELNPWTVLYMMIAVVLPSLGITFLIVLTSFTGIPMPKEMFPFIVLGLGLFQFFFLGFVRSRRPAIV
jgi:pilus assembly protein TadC